MEINYKNKRVLITGSSRGIGFAIARGFLEEGARVVLSSRNQNDLDNLKDMYGKEHSSDQLLAFSCDFTSSENVNKLKNSILGIWDGLDIVVANVGSGRSLSDPIPNEDNFEKVFSGNFDAAVHTARVFYPLLKEANGNLLFIASVAGMEALGAPVDYSVAKTAVIAFSKNLARKAAVDGIRVNCIAPGNIFFEGGSWDKKIREAPEQIKQLIDTTVPMQRFGQPEEIVDAVLFLCSERASFITGSVLKVDGGQTTGIF
jgi:3-oxoacyl-[acyl-carrier protein] reductase